MLDTFVALWIVVLALVHHFLYDERRLDGETARAIDQVVSVQKLQSIVKALLAHVGQFLGLGRNEDAAHAHHVLE